MERRWTRRPREPPRAGEAGRSPRRHRRLRRSVVACPLRERRAPEGRVTLGRSSRQTAGEFEAADDGVPARSVRERPSVDLDPPRLVPAPLRRARRRSVTSRPSKGPRRETQRIFAFLVEPSRPLRAGRAAEGRVTLGRSSRQTAGGLGCVITVSRRGACGSDRVCIRTLCAAGPDPGGRPGPAAQPAGGRPGDTHPAASPPLPAGLWCKF